MKLLYLIRVVFKLVWIFVPRKFTDLCRCLYYNANINGELIYFKNNYGWSGNHKIILDDGKKYCMHYFNTPERKYLDFYQPTNEE